MTRKAVEVTGLDFVAGLLKELPERDGRNLIRATIGGIASEARKEIRRAAPRAMSRLDPLRYCLYPSIPLSPFREGLPLP